MSAKCFVIDRVKWIRGTGGNESRLYRDRDGKMCCVGIYLKSCGVPIENLKGIGYATHVRNLPVEAQWLVTTTTHNNLGDSKEAGPIYNVNDDEQMDQTKRETRLRSLFKRVGVLVRFKGAA